jgi:hypothetical protein
LPDQFPRTFRRLRVADREWYERPTTDFPPRKLLSSVLFSAAKEFALTGHLPHRLNGKFHLIFALTVIVAMIIRREWFHKLLAPVFAVLFLLYITLLFERL